MGCGGTLHCSRQTRWSEARDIVPISTRHIFSRLSAEQSLVPLGEVNKVSTLEYRVCSTRMFCCAV